MKRQWLDVSALEPPEPLTAALAAAEALAPGEQLQLRHRRDPCLLYANLARRGFAWRDEVREEGRVELIIWRLP